MHRVQVFDEVALGGAGTVEQCLVEVRQGHAGARFVSARTAHPAKLPAGSHCSRRCAGVPLRHRGVSEMIFL